MKKPTPAGSGPATRLLVTGASGVLGRALMRRLAGRNSVGVSKSGAEGALRCDLSKKDEVSRLFAAESPGLVLHAAAYSDVDGCENNPVLAYESNALAVKHLAEACCGRQIPLLHVSTDYVFDGRKKTPYEENDSTAPINVYGMSKLAGEYYARQAPAGAIVRTSWLFGRGNAGNFVNAIVERMKKEPVVRVLDDQVDSPTYAEDLAEALERIADHLLGPASKKARQGVELFQVCNAGSTTRYAMTHKIKDILGLDGLRVEKAEKNTVKNRAAIRPAYGVLSTRRYEKFFHVRLRPWEEALESYLKGDDACAS